MVGHVPLEDGIGVRVPAPQPFDSWFDKLTTRSGPWPTNIIELHYVKVEGLERGTK